MCRFDSNKLDYVSKYLGIGEKVRHEGHELWVKCMEKDNAAWKRMKEYNANGSPCWRYCDEALARIAEIGKDAPASKCLTATEVMRAQANPFGRWVWVPETTQEEG